MYFWNFRALILYFQSPSIISRVINAIKIYVKINFPLFYFNLAWNIHSMLTDTINIEICNIVRIQKDFHPIVSTNPPSSYHAKTSSSYVLYCNLLKYMLGTIICKFLHTYIRRKYFCRDTSHFAMPVFRLFSNFKTIRYCILIYLLTPTVLHRN